MFKNKTTVLFVDSGSTENKSMKVPTKILLHWKKYFLISMSVITGLLLLLGFFIYEMTSKHYNSVYQAKIQKLNQINNSLDIENTKKNFQSIDRTINLINETLRKRGLKEMDLEPVGGPVEENLENIKEISSNYEEAVLKLGEELKSIPIGIPHSGQITSTFGTRSNPFSGEGVERHAGIDFRGQTGEAVKVTAQGKVAFAGVMGGYGNVIVVKHSDHFETRYAHLSKLLVAEGQKVNIGSVIGEVGSSGRSTGPHLHYEILYKNNKIDPKPFLDIFHNK
ncbi:M23 family metallopeptidase [Elizabethkingia meningoseptica]|uniref:Peptidase M23 n=2 Tax=Elizabethkingia meningoseptica TaxID=238 RepID=A0A1V3TYF5_ELIME|nr:MULTISPECIES: M23 family metallopeptidase [Elizabethkingia]AQX05708.1 peptidase M23 [Elizabethkingia meningoseptica]AQX13256.1 peptidase M23 [Elizabethkingia meningoseptica]AQX47751.1 peptidase M23 [Elizabethkingia meningoseptica]EJK5328978.1 M23 family metallopeptidase [Elizabethkingia meningoseptica]EOR30623.1 peptidase M23B [Elizabethkingia meningoseptica ATCC 13253 = NBRC 12535]